MMIRIVMLYALEMCIITSMIPVKANNALMNVIQVILFSIMAIGVIIAVHLLIMMAKA